MTDFLRNILVTAAANANAAAAHANNANNDVKVELSQPMHALIQIPAATTTAPTTPSPMAVEKQRLIKVEITETPSDAGKAQRAARRDVVNARRDKRKAMAHATTSPASPSMHTSGCSSSSDDDDDMDDYDDKSKKMKTGASTSVAVAGGLGASDKASRPSFSSTMPPTPGLLFTPEIDAAGEERLRAMEAQLETLDPDSKEAKKKRRLIRNRMSAQLHRERKKAYVGQLEDQLMEKDRELKLLQEKLAQLMAEKETTAKSAAETTTPPAPAQPVVETPAPVAPVVAEEQEPKATTPAPTVDEHKTVDDEIVIKEEPATWDSPWAMDSWALDGLEDAEMADSDLDLLRDFDDPFAGLGGAADYGVDMTKPHHEIHAAKKNLAMMAAVMFSVSFFGNTPSFYNVTPGSNFSSMFGAHTAKDLSQMSVASRIVACLEKTSWKEFRDVSTWLSAQTKEGTTATTEEEVAVASPSAASDVTDATTEAAGSPAHSVDEDVPMETDLIDEFEYPVDDAFASAHSADWFAADHDVLAKEQPETTKVDTTTTVSSLSSRLYEKLTALWREKNQVLLTVRDDKQQVLQRSVADMSSIREGLQSGNLFAKVFGADVEAAQDQSVTFLYPMSAFSQESKPSLQPAEVEGVDPMFLEVSCQMNGGVATSMM